MKSASKRAEGGRVSKGSKSDAMPRIVQKLANETTYEAPKVISLDLERMLRRADVLGVASIPQLTMMGNF